MDTDNKFWKNVPEQRAIYDNLMKMMACPLDADALDGPQIDAVACNYFVGKGLEKIYGISDFGPTVNQKWLTANEIAAWVRGHTDLWSKLGNADDQNVLREAAQGASNGQPVIATMVGDPHGHVAIVLGGTLQPSTKWKTAQGAFLQVPNSASFSLNDVNKAYVFCRLSAAFSDPTRVEIYWRVKQQ